MRNKTEKHNNRDSDSLGRKRGGIGKSIKSTITIASIVALLNGDLAAQGSCSNDNIRNSHIENFHGVNTKEDIYTCKWSEYENNEDSGITTSNKLKSHDMLYNDCDTIRVYDLYIDSVLRKDNFIYDGLIDSIYLAEGRYRKNMGRTMLPLSDKIKARFDGQISKYTVNNAFKHILNDISLYLNDTINSPIPDDIKQSLNYIYSNFSPDILNITVPATIKNAGTTGVKWLNGQPSHIRKKISPY